MPRKSKLERVVLTPEPSIGATENPDAFTQNIITPMENGNGANMPSPFAAGGQSNRIPELAAGAQGFQPEIRILTRLNNGDYAYDAQVRQWLDFNIVNCRLTVV